MPTVQDYLIVAQALDGGEGSGVQGHTTDKPSTPGKRSGGLAALYEKAKALRDHIDKALGESHPAAKSHSDTVEHIRQHIEAGPVGVGRFAG